MTNMLSVESLIGGANVNSSTELQSTGSLLEMSTLNVESSLSPSFRLSNDTITSIWIGSRCVEMMTRKLTNLTVKERFAFNVSLRMFTRSIVIQRRVEDLQLGVESYQKKLNLIKPNTYHFDLKRKEAYSAYSNPRGFIYQNKDKQNRLMRIDELHKFNDGTLNDPKLEGSTQGYPLVSVEVLRYDKMSKSENMGIVLTEMELLLEHTQQGISHEVSITSFFKYDVEYNVFAIERQQSKQPESISNTCVVEKVDSNVIPESSYMCDNDIQTDQNVVECDDERVTLANLISSLKLDVDANKKDSKAIKESKHITCS
nr:hypothetical protein [Tanacetum cinerariifolium]